MIVQDTMEIYHHFTTAFEPISSHSSYTLHIHTYSTLHIHYIVISDVESNTSLAAPGALAHRLQNPKWPPGGPEMADGV